MKLKKQLFVVLSVIAIITTFQCSKLNEIVNNHHSKPGNGGNSPIETGKQIFRFDTFGDEDFWSGLLHIDKAIAGSANGGFEPGVSPVAALEAGLKVDVEALPAEAIAALNRSA